MHAYSLCLRLVFAFAVCAAFACGSRTVTTAWEDGRPHARGEALDGLREGWWVFWRRDGSVSMRGAFAHGLRTGRWESYTEAGQPRVSADWSAGREDGAWIEWQGKDLAAVDGRYVDGRREGTWTARRPSGEKRLEIDYRSGEPDGAYREYDDNARLVLSGDRVELGGGHAEWVARGAGSGKSSLAEASCALRAIEAAPCRVPGPPRHRGHPPPGPAHLTGAVEWSNGRRTAAGTAGPGR